MLAYAVARRSREIGIRVALGAGRCTVVRTVLSRVFAVLAIGVALASSDRRYRPAGLVNGARRVAARAVPAAAIASRLGLIALASCAGPVRRSLRIDPLTALREE